MADSRSKNTPGNYNLEQQQYLQSRAYNTNIMYGESYNTSYAGNGLQSGSIPRDKLSNNPIEIESNLFGIGSTNLVTPYISPKPQLKKMNIVNIFDNERVIMPNPLVIEKNMRPNIYNN
jgi:hypothetical protein